MTEDFRLLMLSAMYENGGNTSHRFLDGHPQMFVYPFESQLGTRLVNDNLSSMFPVKYRWPVFALESTPPEDFVAMIDEETRIRARTPQVSKFRHMPFDFSDTDRCTKYVEHISTTGRSRANNVAAFFRATFDAWKDYQRTPEQVVYVGYSPIIIVDADKILSELPLAHVLHVVRNPWSSYADNRKRPVPMSLADYMLAWTINQYYALLFRDMFPGRVHIVRTEDLLSNPKGMLTSVCEAIGLEGSDALGVPSWNGTKLDEVYPWGTIREPTERANRATAAELTAEETSEIRTRAGLYLDVFDYSGFA